VRSHRTPVSRNEVSVEGGCPAEMVGPLDVGWPGAHCCRAVNEPAFTKNEASSPKTRVGRGETAEAETVAAATVMRPGMSAGQRRPWAGDVWL